MAKKINGYARDNYGVIEFVELGKPEEGAWHEATLVVGKERVFTETEVRAYADDLLSAHLSPGQVIDRGSDGDEPLYQWIERAIKIINAKHGITL